jgi:hypothetical protein
MSGNLSIGDGTDLDIGNGGYEGSIPCADLALSRGDVGSATDNGHSPAWCNAINPLTSLPNSQPDCGEAGGGFVLDPENNLLGYQVSDFIKTSELDQTLWALRLTKAYYGQPARGTTGSACPPAAARAGRWHRVTQACSMGSSSGSRR